MTNLKADAAPFFVKRPATTFRLRQDYAGEVTAECKRLGCSKGVYFEVLLEKAWRLGLVTEADVFQYDAECRRLSAELAPKG